jgi:hypothetical protein
MADNLMTPEEIQAEIETIHAAAQRLGYMTQGMIDALKDAEKGIRGYTALQKQKTAELKASLKDFGTSMAGLFEGLAEGKTGMAAYSGVMTGSMDAVGRASSQYGKAGKGFAVLLKILSFGITEISKMSDALYKANQDISKAGAVGAGGMTEVFNSMQKFGYGVGELGDMTSLLTKNSKALALFGGTANEGARRFANAAGVIQHSDLQQQFMNMGISVNSINEGIAGYLQLQTNLGTSQKLTNKEISQGSADYIMNMSKLSKLTGMSADQLQKERDKLDTIDTFLAVLSKQAAAGPEGRKRAEEVYNSFLGIMSRSETLGLGLAQQYSGTLAGGEESMKAFMSTGGASLELVRALKEGTISGTQFDQSIVDATKGTFNTARNTALINGAGKDVYLSVGDYLKVINTDFVKSMQDITDSTNGAAAGSDKVTDENTKLLRAQMSSRDGLQNLFFKGIGPLNKAFTWLNESLNKVLGWFGFTGSVQEKATTPASSGAGKATTPASSGAGKSISTSAQDLRSLGLNIRSSGDVQKSGAVIDSRLIDLAKQVQGQVAGFSMFTSFNDNYHQAKAPGSQHAQGRAIDFTLSHRPTEEEGQAIVKQIKAMGADFVLDEYNHPSSGSTGGHIHVQFNKANTATTASTPASPTAQVPAAPTNNYKDTKTTDLAKTKVPKEEYWINDENNQYRLDGLNEFLSAQQDTIDYLSASNDAIRKTSNNTAIKR